MNSTNSSCTSSGSFNQQEPVPVWAATALVIFNMFILTGNLVGFSWLLRFTLKSKKKDKTPSHIFFIAISIVSFLGSVIGIPISIYAAWNRFQNKLQTAISHYIQGRVLYLTFSLVMHYFACITTERYITITSKTRKISALVTKRAIALVTVYTIILWLVIIFDDVCIYTPINCASEIWCVLHNQQEGALCSSNTTTAFNNSQNHELRSSKVPLIVITIWMTLCNMVISSTTFITLRFIRKSIKNAVQHLQRSASKFESRRLIVLYAMSTFFSVLWIPYGVVAGQRKNMDPQTHDIVQTFVKTACYASFFVVPITVFIMDKRFSSYVKSTFNSIFRPNKVSSIAAPFQNRR